MTAEPAPAKVNLGLHVRARRPDGYHALETLFAFTRFGDELSAEPADAFSLDVVGPTAGLAGPTADNLVLRAAQAFAEASGHPDRYRLRLDKRIPVAAGLGGGSADAAATLRLLNRLAGHPLDAAALAAVAAGLGADVPACLRSDSCLGTGRGEELAPGPRLGGIPILLVNPGVPVPTGPVFAGWDGKDRGPFPADWRGARNDLTTPAIAIAPVIATVLDWLQSLPGATFVAMSGSGATCLALFEGQDACPPLAVPPAWWSVATHLL